MHASPTPPRLLSTAPTRRADKYAAFVIIALSLIVLALLLPYADRPTSQLIAFIPAGDTGFALTYLITATLLIGQFLQLRSPSALVLGSGYFFACFIVITHLLSDAQSLRMLHPRAANELTTARLFTLWHSLFPIYVVLYALLSRSRHDKPVSARWLLPLVAASVAGAILVTALAVIAAIAAPPLSAGPAAVYGALQAGALSSWLISAAALAVLYARTRAARILDLWLCVVLVAWLLDITVGGLIGGSQYSVGWYAGRIYGVLAAGLILSALLLETGSLYARLTRALADIDTQSVALSESEAALRQAQKMEAIGQITGGVAHDFNNLLTVIIGSLDILKSRERDARSARLADYAMEAAVKGEKLTKQLLAFSRRQMLNPEIRDPNRLIHEFEGLMRRALGETIDIVLELEPAIGAVEVDPPQFESAILNLAVNARDAMNGAGSITIETRSVDLSAPGEPNPAPFVMIAVSDTGAGMDAETASRVFEPFFTTKPPGKGSGLGLSQVYGFVKSSNGSVRIDTAPGKGTTVSLYLPRVAGIAPPLGETTMPDAIQQATEGETILIVEDDPGVLEMAVETLSELGYGVQTATSGSAALERIRALGKVDLLFSDIVMPDGMNGVELSRLAREIRPNLKILLTSGYAADALDNAEALPSDIRIISKPYRLEELAEKLRQVIDGA